MSEKRTSVESSQEDSDLVCQREDNVKRAKVISLSDATLEDLPLEQVIRALATEVEEMHLAKSAWKKKADLVISRLRTTCPNWDILSTDFLQNELYRILDSTAEKTFHLKILQQSSIKCYDVHGTITFKDEVLVLCKLKDEDAYVISVYGRNDLAEVQDVIALPGMLPRDLTACSVSNCLYALNLRKNAPLLVVRITKKGEHEYSVSPLIAELWKPSFLHVSANGFIVLWKCHGVEKFDTIFVYDACGSMLYKMNLAVDRYGFFKITSIPNGNLVLVSNRNENDGRTKLTEIDMTGMVLRQYQSSVCADNRVCLVGQYGRLLLVGRSNEIELLDAEFNRLNIIAPQLNKDLLATDTNYLSNLHYNGERNEVTLYEDDRKRNILSIFHCSEEIVSPIDWRSLSAWSHVKNGYQWLQKTVKKCFFL